MYNEQFDKIRNLSKIYNLDRGYFMHISATELNKHPGKYLTEAIKEPVVIEKTGHPFVVMVSYSRYEEMEDAYWGELALAADKEKSLGTKKTMEFLNSND